MTFLYTVLILLAITGFAFIVAFTLIAMKHKKMVVGKLNSLGAIKEVKSRTHDFEITYEGQEYKIKLLYAPGAVEVSFNSKRHWQIFTTSNKKMAETNGFYDLEGKKLLVIYPNPGKIVRYINENEIVFVTPQMDVFGMNVIHSDQIESYFNQK